METPERALCISLKLVLFFGMADHLLRIIHDDVAVGKATLQHQAVMDTDVVVDAAVVSSAVFAKWTVPFYYLLGIHRLVPLTYCLVLVEVVQSNHRRRVPVVVIALLDHHTGTGVPGRLSRHIQGTCRFAPSSRPKTSCSAFSNLRACLEVGESSDTSSITRVEVDDVQP